MRRYNADSIEQYSVSNEKFEKSNIKFLINILSQ